MFEENINDSESWSYKNEYVQPAMKIVPVQTEGPGVVKASDSQDVGSGEVL